MKKALKLILIFIFIIGIIAIYSFLLLMYGPKNNFRDWLITTALQTRNHKYLATFFYDDETINDSLNRNYIKAFTVNSN